MKIKQIILTTLIVSILIGSNFVGISNQNLKSNNNNQNKTDEIKRNKINSEQIEKIEYTEEYNTTKTNNTNIKNSQVNPYNYNFENSSQEVIYGNNFIYGGSDGISQTEYKTNGKYSGFEYNLDSKTLDGSYFDPLTNSWYYQNGLVDNNHQTNFENGFFKSINGELDTMRMFHNTPKYNESGLSEKIYDYEFKKLEGINYSNSRDVLSNKSEPYDYYEEHFPPDFEYKNPQIPPNSYDWIRKDASGTENPEYKMKAEGLNIGSQVRITSSMIQESKKVFINNESLTLNGGGVSTPNSIFYKDDKYFLTDNDDKIYVYDSEFNYETSHTLENSSSLDCVRYFGDEDGWQVLDSNGHDGEYEMQYYDDDFEFLGNISKLNSETPDDEDDFESFWLGVYDSNLYYFIIGNDNDQLYWFDASLDYHSQSNLPSGATNPKFIYFDDQIYDEYKWYIGDSNNEEIYIYDLEWDYESKYDYSSESSDVIDLTSTYQKWYLLDNTNDKIDMFQKRSNPRGMLLDGINFTYTIDLPNYKGTTANNLEFVLHTIPSYIQPEETFDSGDYDWDGNSFGKVSYFKLNPIVTPVLKYEDGSEDKAECLGFDYNPNYVYNESSDWEDIGYNDWRSFEYAEYEGTYTPDTYHPPYDWLKKGLTYPEEIGEGLWSRYGIGFDSLIHHYDNDQNLYRNHINQGSFYNITIDQTKTIKELDFEVNFLYYAYLRNISESQLKEYDFDFNEMNLDLEYFGDSNYFSLYFYPMINIDSYFIKGYKPNLQILDEGEKYVGIEENQTLLIAKSNNPSEREAYVRVELNGTDYSEIYPITNELWTNPNHFEVDIQCDVEGLYLWEVRVGNPYNLESESGYFRVVDEGYPRESILNFYGSDGLGLQDYLVKSYVGFDQKNYIDNFNHYNEKGWFNIGQKGTMDFSKQYLFFSSPTAFQGFGLKLDNEDQFYINYTYRPDNIYTKWSDTLSFDFRTLDVEELLIVVNLDKFVGEYRLEIEEIHQDWEWRTYKIKFDDFEIDDYETEFFKVIESIGFYMRGNAEFDNICGEHPDLPYDYEIKKEFFNPLYEYKYYDVERELTAYHKEDGYLQPDDWEYPNTAYYPASDYSKKPNNIIIQFENQYSMLQKLNYENSYLRFDFIINVFDYFNYEPHEYWLDFNLELHRYYNSTHNETIVVDSATLDEESWEDYMWKELILICPAEDIQETWNDLPSIFWFEINFTSDNIGVPIFVETIRKNAIISEEMGDISFNYEGDDGQNHYLMCDISHKAFESSYDHNTIVERQEFNPETEVIELSAEQPIYPNVYIGTNPDEALIEIRLYKETGYDSFQFRPGIPENYKFYWENEKYSSHKYYKNFTLNDTEYFEYEVLLIEGNQILINYLAFSWTEESMELGKESTRMPNPNKVEFLDEKQTILIRDYFGNDIYREIHTYKEIIDIQLNIFTIVLHNPTNSVKVFSFERNNIRIEYSLYPQSYIKIRSFTGVYKVEVFDINRTIIDMKYMKFTNYTNYLISIEGDEGVEPKEVDLFSQYINNLFTNILENPLLLLVFILVILSSYCLIKSVFIKSETLFKIGERILDQKYNKEYTKNQIKKDLGKYSKYTIPNYKNKRKKK